MEELVIGLYVLSLLACCVCLWLWYELESHKDHVKSLRHHISDFGKRIEELEKRKR